MKYLFFLAVASLAATGCNASGSKAAAAEKADEVAVRVGSRAFTNSELDTRLKTDIEAFQKRAAAAEAQITAQLEDMHRQVREQEYNLRKKALTEVLFEMEATQKGLTRNTLVEQEITSKAVVTRPDIDQLWEKVKDGAKGSTKEQMQGQLQQMIAQQKTEAQLSRYQRELFKKYKVSFIGLQPQRKVVAVPADAPALGPANASVTIVEFTDYQCPYCQQAQQYVEQVMTAYKDRVRLVYRDFPLDFHAQAKSAGVAARCGGDQGKFWELHTNLLNAPGKLDQVDFATRAGALGLDVGRFQTCLASGKFDAQIQKSIEDGKAVGVSGTPTFLINGRAFSGAQPFEAFERIIEEELAFPAPKTAKQ